MTAKGMIVGFGGQGKQLFLAMRSLNIDVVAVCDINPAVFAAKPETKESWASSFPNLADCGPLPPKIYNDWQQCLQENKGLDMVAVATWTRDHAPVAIAAAESGNKAILCEEPMATSLEDARKIIDACEEHNVLLQIHHTRRWWPAHQAIQKNIQDGNIGELRHIWISCGGARLGDLGTHWIDWCCWVTGEKAESVVGWLYPITESNPRGQQFLDYPGDVFIRFANGVTAFINQGAGIALPPRYEIVGSKGRIKNDQIGNDEDWFIQARPEKTPLSAVRDYYGKLEGIALPLSQMRPEIKWKEIGIKPLEELLAGYSSCDGEEGYKTLEILVASHLSSESGNMPVKLPLSCSDLERSLKNA